MKYRNINQWHVISDLLHTENDIYNYINERLNTIYRCEFENKINSSYKSAVFDMKKVLYFIESRDDLIGSLEDKRYTQIRSYNTNINFNFLNTIYEAVIQANIWGSSLLNIEPNFSNSLENGNLVHKKDLRIELVPQFSWILLNNKEIVLDKSCNYEKDNLYIIKSNKNRGVIWNILFRSISKQFAYNKIYSAANSLAGINSVKIDTQALMQDINFLSGGNSNLLNDNNPDQANLTWLHSYIQEQMSALENNDTLLTTNSMEIQHINMADTTATQVFDGYINKMEALIQTAIIGQAGTTFESSVGSFARAKEMNLTTIDIKYSDIILLEEVINDIILKYNLSKGKFYIITDDTDYITKYISMLSQIKSLGASVEIDSADFYKTLGLKNPNNLNKKIIL